MEKEHAREKNKGKMISLSSNSKKTVTWSHGLNNNEKNYTGVCEIFLKEDQQKNQKDKGKGKKDHDLKGINPSPPQRKAKQEGTSGETGTDYGLTPYGVKSILKKDKSSKKTKRVSFVGIKESTSSREEPKSEDGSSKRGSLSNELWADLQRRLSLKLGIEEHLDRYKRKAESKKKSLRTQSTGKKKPKAI